MSPPARILLVEDDNDIRNTLAEVLADEGYAVSCAANGAEALAALERLDAPALILLDLMMPVMDGWAFRSAQRRDPRLAGIPVLVVSASHGDDGRNVDELGVDGFLAKPFNLASLVDAVHKFC